MTFTISQTRESYCCPECGSEDVIGRGHNRRRFRMAPIGGKPVWLALAVPRVECRDCGAVRQVKVGFADSRVSYTRSFQRYALELSRQMTIKDAACHLGISWDVIKEIQKQDLERRIAKPKWKHLKGATSFPIPSKGSGRASRRLNQSVLKKISLFDGGQDSGTFAKSAGEPQNGPGAAPNLVPPRRLPAINFGSSRVIVGHARD